MDTFIYPIPASDIDVNFSILIHNSSPQSFHQHKPLFHPIPRNLSIVSSWATDDSSLLPNQFRSVNSPLSDSNNCHYVSVDLQHPVDAVYSIKAKDGSIGKFLAQPYPASSLHRLSKSIHTGHIVIPPKTSKFTFYALLPPAPQDAPLITAKIFYEIVSVDKYCGSDQLLLPLGSTLTIKGSNKSIYPQLLRFIASVNPIVSFLVLSNDICTIAAVEHTLSPHYFFKTNKDYILKARNLALKYIK
jgi:hypothetical protein